MSPKTKPSYYLTPHTAMLKWLEENNRRREKQSFSVVTKGTNCSVWFQPDRWSSWGTQLIFNLIGWRGKLWAKWGHMTIEAIQTGKKKLLKVAEHKSSMGDWKGQYTELQTQNSIKNVPFYPLSYLLLFVKQPCSDPLLLCEVRVNSALVSALSSCQIQSGNFYYSQICVTLVIPL